MFGPIIIAITIISIIGYLMFGFAAMHIYKVLGYKNPGFSAFLPIYNSYVMMKVIADGMMSDELAEGEVKSSEYKERRASKALKYFFIVVAISAVAGVSSGVYETATGSDMNIHLDLTSLLIDSIITGLWFYHVQRLLTPQKNENLTKSSVIYALLNLITAKIASIFIANRLTDGAHAKYRED